MSCMSLEFLKQLLIDLVVIGAFFAIIKLIVPLALTWLGGAGSVIAQVINIILYAIIIIFVIIIVFNLLGCLLGAGGGLHFPSR
jgi:hypothetical protein